MQKDLFGNEVPEADFLMGLDQSLQGLFRKAYDAGSGDELRLIYETARQLDLRPIAYEQTLGIAYIEKSGKHQFLIRVRVHPDATSLRYYVHADDIARITNNPIDRVRASVGQSWNEVLLREVPHLMRRFKALFGVAEEEVELAEDEDAGPALAAAGDSLDAAISRREGVEYEEFEDSDVEIQRPFDPTKIDVDSKSMTVDLLIKRIREDEIDLQPSFQRHAGIWKDRFQSRLIESMLIRIPLPAFYFDASDDDLWLVIDGLQRLTTIRRFVVTSELRLQGLEFLQEYEGKYFSELPRSLQRRIEETQITVYLVKRGTPHNVKFNIFKRINTGGLPLSGQEIRHALNQGPVTDMLARLAESQEFKHATASGISPLRMTDREMVLRFLAFYLQGPEQYYKERAELETFLNEEMQQINKMTEAEREELERIFFYALDAAYRIFGSYAFRKQRRNQDRRSPVSKALFEVWTVNLARLAPEEIDLLVRDKDTLTERFYDLMEDSDFDYAISYATGDPRRVQYRFELIARIIQQTIDQEPYPGPDSAY